jgi:hypothetical protein
LHKELHYEYVTLPRAEKSFKCVVDRLSLQIREDSSSGAMQAENTDRNFIASLNTVSTGRGGLKVVVRIRLFKEEQLSAVLACFGDPHKERDVAPTATMFAEIVNTTILGENVDIFIKQVCEKLDIPIEEFGNYRAMVLSTSILPSASKTLKDAAEKLRNI